MKIIARTVNEETRQETELIEMFFPAEKKQETKVLKFLKSIQERHVKKKGQKLSVTIQNNF